jgi:hypothetical protein
MSRRIERRRRRNRLRVTAGPRARLSENATEVVVVEGSGHHVHHRAERRIRMPSCVRRRKASRPRIRAIKPRGGPGPWRGGSSARRARRESTSGHGTRGAWLAGDCWAEMCASRNSSWAALALHAQPVAVCLMQDVVRQMRDRSARATWQGYRATEGARQPARKQPNRRSLGTFWHADGSCYGPAPATWQPACPQVWTSVWTFARRAFQACDQEKHQRKRHGGAGDGREYGK